MKTTKGNEPPKDIVEQLMEEAGIPRTRENYLMVAYLGNPPAELSEEEEEELPDAYRGE